MRRTNTFIGSPVERVEDLRFLRGRGQYVDDLVRPDTWHAEIVRSPVAHGRLRGIDASAALKMPGVHAVLTAADVGDKIPVIPMRRANPAVAPYEQPVIAHGKVRYVGEPVAMVLADSAQLAEDAAALVEVDIEHLPTVPDWQAAVKSDVLLVETTKSNIAAAFVSACGDADAAFAKAHYTRKERFRVQRLTAMPMETRGLLAEWNAAEGRVIVSGAAKLPFFNKRALAKMMGLPEEKVDYIEYDVGGGFGARGEFYPEDFLCAFAARKYGHPVKWVEDRREHFMAINHSRECEAELEVAFDKNGILLGLRGDVWCNIGAYMRPNGTTPVRNVAQFTSGPYCIPNQRVRSHALVSNKTPSGTYRGPGRFEGCFFMDRLMDLAAKDLGIDRLELRKRNLIRLDQMPFQLPTVEPGETFAESFCDSGNYTEPLERCLKEAGWDEKIKLNGKLIDGRYHGVGLACFIEGGGSGPKENARIAVERDGTISVFIGSSAVGQGIETIMGQIAADALEVPLDRVTVYHGSTTILPDGVGAFGSRSTVMGGSAIVVAANALVDKFRAAAAEKLVVGESELSISEGVASAPDGRKVALGDLAGENLVADGVYAGHHHTYTYGTTIAHVAVDPGTGGVEVIDFVTVDDVGRIVNPLTLHGQVMGAVVQGLGSVFSEEVAYDEDGQLLVGSLADYMVPLATDYPNITAISLELHPSPNNPLGVKGAGEGGLIPVAGALSNAVAQALSSLGVEPTELPLSPPRVWQMIQDAKVR
jgi:carbon-monoxide dehydrogenase large subunit